MSKEQGEDTYYKNGLRQDLRDVKRELNSVKTRVENTNEKCDSIQVLLQGDPSSDEPEGIVHKVYQNTNFRKRSGKVIWAVLLLVLGLVLKEVWRLIVG